MNHRTVHYETSQLKMSSTKCTLLSAVLTAHMRRVTGGVLQSESGPVSRCRPAPAVRQQQPTADNSTTAASRETVSIGTTTCEHVADCNSGKIGSGLFGIILYSLKNNWQHDLHPVLFCMVDGRMYMEGRQWDIKIFLFCFFDFCFLSEDLSNFSVLCSGDLLRWMS